MHHLSGIKIIIISFAICLTSISSLTAQFKAKGNYNFLEFNKKNYYFGMAFGTNFAGYRVDQSKFFIGNESIQIAEGKSRGGFNLNMITNLKMGEFFDLRFTPGFAFSYRSFLYNDIDENRIESVFVEVPFAVRYKSLPYKDKRVFLTGGLKYSYDVASNSNTRKAETLIRISPHDFQWEAGIGMQFFYPYFIFSPEIKYSRGFGNILIYNSALIESRVLENVVSQIITLSFNFEG